MPPTGTETRQLAAIMFTDMVGFSVLTQRDDAMALSLLEQLVISECHIIKAFCGDDPVRDTVQFVYIRHRLQSRLNCAR